MTQTETTKLAILSSRDRLIELLDWSEDGYGNFQYKRGLAYIAEASKENDEAADVLERSKIFWNWWKNQWLSRDELFLHDLDSTKSALSLATRRGYYKIFHNPEVLAREGIMHGSIMEDSYAEMIGKIHDGL